MSERAVGESDLGAEEVESPLVRFAGARIGHGRQVLLDDVGLEIRRGDFLAIVGPNGSGKTTLLRCLLGVLRPLSGTCEVAASCGYAPQRGQLDPIFPFTAEEVVAMGLLGIEERSEEIDVAGQRAAVASALDACGMLPMRDRLFRELSGGQKQRVLVARALVSEPDLLVLDEPTNDLDLRGEHEVMELVRRLHEAGRTVVMVSHILHVVSRYARRIAFLHDRRLDVGDAAEMLGPERLHAVYGLEVDVVEGADGRRLISGSRDA